MNIIEELKKENIKLGIKDYDIDDYLTQYEMSQIINNYEKIKKAISKINVNINNTDDYINYLFLKHICNYKNYIQHLEKEYIDSFNEFIKFSQKYFDKYEIKDVLKYVENKYKDLLEYKDNLHIKADLREDTIDIIGNYLFNSKDIINYLCTEYSYAIIDSYDLYRKSIKKHNLFPIFLSKNNIKKNLFLRQEEIGKILNSLKKDEVLYDSLVSNYVEVAKNEFFNIDEKNVGRKIGLFRTSVSILDKLHHPEYSVFEKEYKKASDLLNRSLEKTGSKFSFEIDLSTLYKVMDNESIDYGRRAYILTEYIDEKTKKHQSVAKTILEKKETYIIDMVSTNIPTDKVFTFSTIENTRIMMFALSKGVNRLISSDEKLIKLCEHIGMSIKSYLEENNIEYDKENLKTDINHLCFGIRDLIRKFEIKNKNLMEVSCYSCINLICGLIEKFLRTIYCNENSKIYLKTSSTSLKTYLNDSKVKKIISEDLANLLEYYLLYREGVGLNIRNDLSHYNDNVYSFSTYGTFSQLLLLLLMLCNRVVSYLYD